MDVSQAVTNIINWGDSGLEIHVTANQIMHTSGALKLHPDNIEGMTVADRNALLAAEDYSSWTEYDCYGGYARLHHQKNTLADHYDVHGFHSSNYHFSHDLTEKYEFENLYQIKGLTPTPPGLGDREVPPSYNLS